MVVSRRQVVVGSGAVGLGLVVGCGRWPGQAEPPPTTVTVLRVGYLIAGPDELTSPPPPGTSPGLDAWRQGLADYGYHDGQNLVIEYRATGQGPERLRELATELARLPVDVIVAVAGAALPAKE